MKLRRILRELLFWAMSPVEQKKEDVFLAAETIALPAFRDDKWWFLKFKWGSVPKKRDCIAMATISIVVLAAIAHLLWDTTEELVYVFHLFF